MLCLCSGDRSEAARHKQEGDRKLGEKHHYERGTNNACLELTMHALLVPRS